MSLFAITDSYINSQKAAERAFGEGHAEYEEIQEDCLEPSPKTDFESWIHQLLRLRYLHFDQLSVGFQY